MQKKKKLKEKIYTNTKPIIEVKEIRHVIENVQQ